MTVPPVKSDVSNNLNLPYIDDNRTDETDLDGIQQIIKTSLKVRSRRSIYTNKNSNKDLPP